MYRICYSPFWWLFLHHLQILFEILTLHKYNRISPQDTWLSCHLSLTVYSYGFSQSCHRKSLQNNLWAHLGNHELVKLLFITLVQKVVKYFKQCFLITCMRLNIVDVECLTCIQKHVTYKVHCRSNPWASLELHVHL